MSGLGGMSGACGMSSTNEANRTTWSTWPIPKSLLQSFLRVLTQISPVLEMLGWKIRVRKKPAPRVTAVGQVRRRARWQALSYMGWTRGRRWWTDGARGHMLRRTLRRRVRVVGGQRQLDPEGAAFEWGLVCGSDAWRPLKQQLATGPTNKWPTRNTN